MTATTKQRITVATLTSRTTRGSVRPTTLLPKTILTVVATIVASDTLFILQNITTDVQIRVLDINDNPATFGQDEYHFLVEENPLPGTLIGRVHARDPDQGPAADVIYGLKHGEFSDIVDIMQVGHVLMPGFIKCQLSPFMFIRL